MEPSPVCHHPRSYSLMGDESVCSVNASSAVRSFGVVLNQLLVEVDRMSCLTEYKISGLYVIDSIVKF